ncbi:DUF4153 domain-containing protein [Sphingomonas rhizophila]|uniref:DUF4153 domain-containing protein n=1 Tax=Sphingomonas rhizophila TaxID=2071607 RepID=A0A7G9SD29_9SPHN|nr:DUF4153 domain-containing protein [Sphingomonas rhizophila]QNN65754.1 DUF4153 domain-containing protein [Sphingomonas rhizophila]
MTAQNGTEREDWPQRPWIMAAIGAASAFIFYLLVDDLNYEQPISATVLLRQAAAAGFGVAALSFLITAEKTRWTWAAAFALCWGMVIALVGYSTGAYSRAGDVVEFPFLSGLLAVGIAAPLFQTMRDEGGRSLPYEKVHRYAWTDGIIGGASLAFTGLTFSVAFLLGSLFDAIGISLLKDLLEEGLFAFSMAGAAFGAASAVLRERDPLLGTLQRLVMLVFSVLAPVLACALAVYLVALPVTGFGGLWKSGLPETPLLLSAAGFAFVFLNAVIGDSRDDRGQGKLWRFTEVVLLVAVLPLGTLALVSMGMRVGQYGWTPERLWGVTACLIAIAFGVSNWWALWRGRGQFDGVVRANQKRLAVGLCGLALFLALPIVDFGAISTRSQVARLQGGKVPPAEFDWTALAFDFGPAGREALQRIATNPATELGRMASAALTATNRYKLYETTEKVRHQATIDRRVRLLSPDIELTPNVRQHLADFGGCIEQSPCSVMRIDATRLLVVWQGGGKVAMANVVDLSRNPGDIETAAADRNLFPKVDNLEKARIEVRTVKRRQAFVDGKPVGDPFE